MSVEARLNTKAQVRRLGIALAVLLAGVVCLPLGASVAVAATPVGVQWTSQTSAANTEWTSVAWGGPAGSQGTFVWSRRTNKRIYVSFSHGSVRYNFVAIPARRD